ncbi:MAG: enoyl-CoA hydratase/isomerase family protein [Silvanigrellaceae bacterium]
MSRNVEFLVQEPGVGIIEISRPEALNALNADVLAQLGQAVDLARKQDDLSAVILRTAGEKAFVAGADIKEMINLNPQQAKDFSKFGQNVFSSLSELPQVVIAQVQGFALGGGLECALAADLIIASRVAKFGLPEVGLGLIPGFGGTQRLVQRLGYARALEWMTSADKYTADAAFALGLLNRVVNPEELAPAVQSLARMIAAQGPMAVRAAKACARVAAKNGGDSGFEFEAQHFGERFSTDESREGLAAFVEKRRPNFRKAPTESSGH